jgi:hypothetical protein
MVKLEYVRDKISPEAYKFILEQDKRGIPHKVIAGRVNEKFSCRLTPRGIREVIASGEMGLDESSRYEIE